MTIKKKPGSVAAAASWITQGRAELQAQTPAQRGIEETPEAPKVKRKGPAQPARERFTANLPPDLIEWARRAVVYTPGLTLAALAERALSRELRAMEKDRGEPFPETITKPRRGRPVSTWKQRLSAKKAAKTTKTQKG
jgi:hypothetical protein